MLVCEQAEAQASEQDGAPVITVDERAAGTRA